MYRTQQIRIRKGHRLHGYCEDLCRNTLNLYNRSTYLVRQYASAQKRLEEGKELTENQGEACGFIEKTTKGTKYYPKGRWLNYQTLDYMLKASEDKDYRALPSQVNQQILKLIPKNFDSFFCSLKEYKIRPECFTGRPRMPGYKKKGGMATALLTNQVCKVKEGRYLTFPKTKERIDIGEQEEGRTLKEVKIKPCGDSFMLNIVMEIKENPVDGDHELFRMKKKDREKHLAGLETNPYRVASIDPGTNNFCAVTNNFGEQPFVVKGGYVKSVNHYYNKKLAKLRSEAKKCNDTYSTRRIERLHGRRNRIIRDQMHKISRIVADWAVKNRVQIVILGHNIFQKRKIRMTQQNNQNFVQIPFHTFAKLLRYKLEEKKIVLIETEEAYTSQADYLEKDPIPKYKRGNVPEMSGRRTKRGMYVHKDGTKSNADINGAANIMRKVFPNVKKWDRGLVDRPYAVKLS